MLRLLVFLRADGPTCQLIVPYLNAAARQGVTTTALSQDDEQTTRAFDDETGRLKPAPGRNRTCDP